MVLVLLMYASASCGLICGVVGHFRELRFGAGTAPRLAIGAMVSAVVYLGSVVAAIM